MIMVKIWFYLSCRSVSSSTRFLWLYLLNIYYHSVRRAHSKLGKMVTVLAFQYLATNGRKCKKMWPLTSVKLIYKLRVLAERDPDQWMWFMTHSLIMDYRTIFEESGIFFEKSSDFKIRSYVYVLVRAEMI